MAGTFAVELTWEADLRFAARAERAGMVLDSAGEAGPSPVQALALALAGCMAMDVVHILTKARVPLAGMHARLVAERAPEEPRRLLKADLHFELRGDVPPDKVERALALSREKYCSVWHSLRPDLEFRTSFEVTP